MEIAILWVLMLTLFPLHGLLYLANRKENIAHRNLIKSTIRLQKQGRI